MKKDAFIKSKRGFRNEANQKNGKGWIFSNGEEILICKKWEGDYHYKIRKRRWDLEILKGEFNAESGRKKCYFVINSEIAVIQINRK